MIYDLPLKKIKRKDWGKIIENLYFMESREISLVELLGYQYADYIILFSKWGPIFFK